MRILVADDNEDVLILIAEACRVLEVECDTFADPTDAIEAFNQSPASYAAAILDIYFMSELDGFIIAKAMRAARGKIPILFVTAYDYSQEPAVKKELKSMGRVLKKPFYQAALIDEIKRLVKPRKSRL